MELTVKGLNAEIKWLEKDYLKSQDEIRKYKEKGCDEPELIEIIKENRILFGKLFEAVRITRLIFGNDKTIYNEELIKEVK